MSPSVINAIPMNWIVVIASLKKKYPTIVTKIIERAIQRMFVMAAPSYFNENAKNSPAPPKQSIVIARKIGFLFMFQNFADITPIRSRMLIVAIRR